MKKLFIDKNEEVASIVDRVISAEDGEVVLVVPKGSTIKESPENLLILKREADSAGKSLLLESVDPDILAAGAKAGIEGFHPLFRDSRARSLSDIVPQGEEQYQKSLEASGRARPEVAKKSPGRILKVSSKKSLRAQPCLSFKKVSLSRLNRILNPSPFPMNRLACLMTRKNLLLHED